MRKIAVDKGVDFGGGGLTFIAGPCVIESREMALDLAKGLSALARRLKVGYVFKASFDKANRTSVDSFRGPGIDKGLEILAEVRQKFGVPVLTDVHEPWQCRVGFAASLTYPALFSHILTYAPRENSRFRSGLCGIAG